MKTDINEIIKSEGDWLALHYINVMSTKSDSSQRHVFINQLLYTHSRAYHPTRGEAVRSHAKKVYQEKATEFEVYFSPDELKTILAVMPLFCNYSDDFKFRTGRMIDSLLDLTDTECRLDELKATRNQVANWSTEEFKKHLENGLFDKLKLFF